MAILRELELPDDLYEHLQKLAFTRNSSIEAQALAILQNAVSTKVQQSEDERRKNVPQIIEESRRRREMLPKDIEYPDSTAMIREDRDR